MRSLKSCLDIHVRVLSRYLASGIQKRDLNKRYTVEHLGRVDGI